MSIRDRAKETFRCIYRSVMGPEIDVDRYVGSMFWLSGFVCCCYWLWRWDILLWPGKKLNAIVGKTPDASQLQLLLFSALAFMAFFVLFVFVLFAVSLWTDKSAREFLSSQRQFVYRALHWVCMGSTFATLVYVGLILGQLAFHRAILWDAWAQSAIFALIGLPSSMLLHYLIKYWKRGKPFKYTLDGPFKPAAASSVTALFVAVWYSYLCIYPLMIQGAYSNLESAYEKCNIFNDVLRADPFLPVNWFDENNESQTSSTGIYRASEKDLDLLHRFLKYTGIVRATTSFDDFKNNPKFSEDVPYFFQRDIVEGGNLSKPVYMANSLLGSNFTSLRFASTLAYRKGGDTIHATEEGERLKKCVAANLAGAPNCESAWKQLNSNNIDDRYGIWELRPVGIPTVVSDGDIVRHLLKVTSRNVPKREVGANQAQPQPLSSLIEVLSQAKAKLKKEEEKQDKVAIAAEVNAVKAAQESYATWDFFSASENNEIAARLLEETLARTHSTPQVKAARYIVALVQGAEQLGMLILAVWLACLLLVRCRNMFKLARMTEWLDITKPEKNRSMNADQVKSFVTRLFALETSDSETVHEDVETRFERIRRVNFEGRWMMRWIAIALPAVGFIGTVRGISAGLGSADAIVRAENVIEQAAAINQVAGSLGVAFTTTLIALVLGLALGILERLEASLENGMLSRLETACVIGSGAQKSD